MGFRGSPSWSDRMLGRVTTGIGAAIAIMAVYVVHASLPVNAVQLPLENTQAIRALVPEGWAFFTASPQTVFPQAYVLSAGGHWVYAGGSLVTPADLFGLDRSLRAQGTEVALLIQGVPPNAWRSCSTVPIRCLANVPVYARVANTSALQNLCGQVGLVRQQMLPWAWRGTGTIMPSTVLRIEVSCRPRR
jgi:antimicrobial peptide system SdpA family protein